MEPRSETAEAPSEVARPGRARDWLYRALLEAVLIVFGVLGGLAVNEWQAAHERQQRAAAAIAAIRSELESNLEALKNVHDYNVGVVEKLRELGKVDAKTTPPSVHPRGLIARPELLSTAWHSAQSQGILIDVPMATLLVVGRAYESQDTYAQSTSRLLDIVYASIFEMRPEMLPPPGLLGGVLNDYVRREGGVMRRYEDALTAINSSQ